MTQFPTPGRDTHLPMRALDGCLKLQEWAKSSMGQKFLEGLINDVTDAPGVQSLVKQCFLQSIGAAQMLSSAGGTSTEVMAVTSEIGHVLETAAATIPNYQLDMSDVIAPYGYVYFEDPLVMPDSYGRALVVRSLSWALAEVLASSTATEVSITYDDPTTHVAEHHGDELKQGLIIFLKTDPLDPRDSFFSGIDPERVDPDAVRLLEAHTGGVIPMWGGMWVVGQEPKGPVARLLTALFRFIGEPWIEERDESPGRACIRRAQRAGSKQSSVRVVHLRKKAVTGGGGESSDDESHREYSCRFLVRGHWRMQWYPSQKRHAPKWIFPYVKGPEDKPLVVKDRVFSVDR